MYSRNAKTHTEERYAKNIPPVYGGSRFYRTPPDRGEEVHRESESAGIAVQYEARPRQTREAEDTVRETDGDLPDAPVKSEDGPAETAATAPQEAPEVSRRERLLPSLLSGNQEELLLIAILLLLCGEEERAPDMIALLLLLIILK